MTKQEEINQRILLEVAVLKEKVAVQKDMQLRLEDLLPRVAILEAQIAEMQKAKESWSQRGWAVVIVLLSAFFSFLSVIVGTLLTAQLRK